MHNGTSVLDKRQRPLRDLRISVTDRCNFRCSYCMPKEVFHPGHKYLSRSNILSLEEIARFAKISHQLGVKKFRLTGGEPLIRRNLEFLIDALANIDDDIDISLTTNGALLTKAKMQSLKDAGLKRITISLDAIEPELFKTMNDMEFPINNVLRGINHAINADLESVKINMVVMKDVNEDQILPMADYFIDKKAILRFIEFMDVGNTNQWEMKSVVAAKTILEKLQSRFEVETLEPNYQGEVAKRWRISNGANTGEVGIVSSISQPFCHDCHRLRLSADGHLYTCLFAQEGFDIKTVLRENEEDSAIIDSLSQLWQQREDRYSELRSQHKVSPPKVEMSYIGG